MEPFLMFTIFYVFFTICFIYPPPAFVSLGITVESLFSSYLGTETQSFVHYHVKRTLATLLTHCSLPLVYFLIASYMFPEFDKGHFWNSFFVLSLLPPTICIYYITMWSKFGWSNHPIAKTLKKFITTGSDINQITRDIDNEFRSINKVIIKCNTIFKVVATDNWIIKVLPYDLCIAHQSDVSLVVTSSDQYQHIPGSLDGGQYLNICVKSSRNKSFDIRINSLDFKDLQEKIMKPINFMDNIVIHQSITDRFLEAFRSHVEENPKIEFNENLDVCIGCMLTQPNVKLFTSCGDVSSSQKCTMCYCRPLWCIDCMGKWFASRQDQDRPETWLSSKCTCPMCRSTFCILDVCQIVTHDREAEDNHNS